MAQENQHSQLKPLVDAQNALVPYWKNTVGWLTTEEADGIYEVYKALKNTINRIAERKGWPQVH